MLPIFKEYISFLNYKTNDLKFLKEGFYWYDRSIIKGFDENGEIIKIARIYVNDNLEIKTKLYSSNIKNVESWDDTIKRYEKELYTKEKESLKLINNSIEKFKDRELFILSSGGKDSSITEYLVRKNNINIPIIFNNTTLDCSDTYKHIRNKNNVIKITPHTGFYQWRKENNFIPTRFARACCSIFKEKAMINNLDKDKKCLFFMGMRNQESSKRSQYGDNWKNKAWGNREWDAVLPIRKWSELEVWLYILKNNISINTKYKKGYSRVGCAIACPFYTKTTWVLDKYWYPKMFDRWQNILVEDFRNNNKDIIMNCTEEEYLTCWNGGRYRDEPTKEVIKQFAERNNLDIKVASNFFNHECKECGKRIKDKKVIGMNMKLQGENLNPDSFLCKKHLMEKYELDKKHFDNIVEIYQMQDCPLF